MRGEAGLYKFVWFSLSEQLWLCLFLNQNFVRYTTAIKTKTVYWVYLLFVCIPSVDTNYVKLQYFSNLFHGLPTIQTGPHSNYKRYWLYPKGDSSFSSITTTTIMLLSPKWDWAMVWFPKSRFLSTVWKVEVSTLHPYIDVFLHLLLFYFWIPTMLHYLLHNLTVNLSYTRVDDNDHSEKLSVYMIQIATTSDDDITLQNLRTLNERKFS